jgi:hypothetical protein
MGITLYSYISKLKTRHASKLRSNCINSQYNKYITHTKYKIPTNIILNIQHQQQIADDAEKQEKLEEQLHQIQERIYMTRLYISRIRHEYEGAARESIEHYVSVINHIYSRVSRHYLDNIRFDTPVSEDFLQEIENEYMQLVLEGGFTEEEAFDYMYGNNTDAWNTDDESVADTTEDADADADAVAGVLGNMTL